MGKIPFVKQFSLQCKNTFREAIACCSNLSVHKKLRKVIYPYISSSEHGFLRKKIQLRNTRGPKIRCFSVLDV